MRQALAASERTGGAGEAGHRGARGASRRPPAYGIATADAGRRPDAPRLTPRTPGMPLPADLRGRMETRFGEDFSALRVHADSDAAALSASIDARAYTLDEAIVFGAGEYRVGSAAGERLIAHELTHVVQQRRSGGGVAVQPCGCVSQPGDPAEREADAVADAVAAGAALPVFRAAVPPGRIARFPYTTDGIDLRRGNIATAASVNYWEARADDAFDLSHSTVSPRMARDREESDAVWATWFALSLLARFTTPIVHIVPIATRQAPPAPAATGAAAAAAPPPPAALLYRITVTPPTAAGGKPSVAFEFLASGAGAIPIAAATPGAGFSAPALNANSSGFPGSRDAFFQAHPEELAQLQNVLASPTPAIDQFVQLTTTDHGTVRHRSLVHVVRSVSGPATSLNIDLISEGAINDPQTVAADYRQHDSVDFTLETLRRTSRPRGDRLGTITLPAGMPPAEAIPVKLAIVAYFSRSPVPARNTEIDAIIPIDATTGSALYTLRFGAHNDVDVVRLGLAGTAAGAVNTARADVTRVNGFPGPTAADAALRAWWTQRYPGGGALTTPVLPPAATTAAPAAAPNAALISEMNGKIAAGAVNATWFSANYGIVVADAAALATRLRTVHSVPAAMTSNTVDFSAADFASLETALETLTASDIANLRGFTVGRKTTSFTRNGSAYGPDAPGQYGLTLNRSVTQGGTTALDRTTVYFDPFRDQNNVLFHGSSAQNAVPDVAMNMLHELGHDAGNLAGVEAAFDAWRARNHPAAPTWYAATPNGAELFPEAYALFHTDPHFLCGSAPALYAWFLALAMSGSPPAASARLPAPTCPP